MNPPRALRWNKLFDNQNNKIIIIKNHKIFVFPLKIDGYANIYVGLEFVTTDWIEIKDHLPISKTI